MNHERIPGWSVFKQIFHDHWDHFKRDHPRYDRIYYDGLVKKMIACGNPEQSGYFEYRCQDCGQGKHVVAMSCKSALCLRCAKVYVDNWVSQVSRMLHGGVIYRHTVLTVPAMLRPTFYYNADVLLDAFMRCGVRCMDDFYGQLSGQKLKGGYIVVLHTHGRNGQYNPHLHLIATSGGWDSEAERWVHLEHLPYTLLNKKWQWHALTMVRQSLDSPAVHRLVDACFRRYPKGFIAQVQKGDVPARYHTLATYLAKYVVTPPISVRRIDRYDGQRVTYHYRSHRSERVEYETVDVHTFIGRMVQHVVPKDFKRIRYYGVQATKTFAKLKPMIQAALARVQHVVKGAIKIIAPMTYRQRYHQSSGRTPCGVRTVTATWPCGAYGILPMVSSMMKPQRSNEVDMNDDAKEPQPREGIDIPFGPPPEEYLYRCPVCGEEALINEEIIDVTVGMLKFRGEYRGGMPTLGCPGCEGDTMEYVEEDE